VGTSKSGLLKVADITRSSLRDMEGRAAAQWLVSRKRLEKGDLVYDWPDIKVHYATRAGKDGKSPEPAG